MESKESKTILKTVKKLIQDKDFEKALKKCKEVLNVEPSNYTGLVFSGFAAQELGKWKEAEDALVQATQIDSTQILAWKGLCTLYEKNSTKDNQSKLVCVYEELLKLHKSDVPKQKELVDKLVNLTQKLKITSKIVEANVLKAELSDNEADKFTAWKTVAINLPNLEVTPERTILRIQALSESLGCDVDEKEKIPLFRELMKLHYQEGRYQEAVEEAHHVLTTVSLDDNEALATICQIFVETTAIGPASVPSDLGEVTELNELLRQSSKDPGLSLVTHGAIQLARKEPWKAMTSLSEGSAKFNRPHTFILLAKAQLESHCYKLAENSAARGLKISSKDDNIVVGNLCLLLAKSLIAQKAKEEAHLALTKSKEKLGETNQTGLCLLDWSLLGSDEVLPEKIIEKLSKNKLSQNEHNELQYLKAKYEFLMKKNYVEARKILDSSVEVSQMNLSLHLRAAIFWESEQYAQALEALVQAIKSDPYHPRNYMYLGDYYHAKENESRACQCYLKGHQLDPCDEEIAKRASDSLLSLDDNKTNQEVLIMITSNNPRAQWAWLRLGVSYLPSDAAVAPLQRAIRLDPNDSSAWECLGDAYLNQGSFGAASKAYNKVVELNPDASYPLFRSAQLKKLTGFPEEAIQGFKAVLKTDPSFVPAIEGLSESCLLLAQEYMSQTLFDLAADSCYEAFHYLTEIILHEQNASCLWKFSGDLHILLASLGPKHFPLKSDKKPSHVPDTKAGLLDSAIRSYGHALAVNPDISWLWQDLGSAYSLLSSEESISKAAACYHQALTLEPLQAEHWLSLGELTAQHMELFDQNLAQHCYIQALQLDPTNAASWSGLGFLYLKAGEVNLAHQAFGRAQDTDPNHVNAWIGQAMVASKISPDDVLYLFWHSTTLSNHPNGLLGYGYSLCSTLLDEGFTTDKEKNRHILNGADCLIHFTANDESSGTAMNALGLLLERLNLFESAVVAFQKALEVLPASFKESVRVNLARVLRCQGKSAEALDVLAQISGSGDPDILCELALCHWSLNNWEQAFKAYQVALQKCPPDVKSHILVAMAMVSKKQKQENTVQLLLESYKHRPVSVAGLLAISAEGFLKNAPRLVEISLSELQKFKLHSDHILHVAHLMSLREIRKDNLRAAIRQMSSAVHQYPAMSVLWTRLSRLLIEEELQTFSSYGGYSLAMHCADAASRLQQSNQDLARQKHNQRLSSLLVRVAAALTEGKNVEALKAAQKATHLCPGDRASWSSLLACLVAENKWNDSVFKHSLMEESDTQQLDWLYSSLAYHYLLKSRIEDAGGALEKVPDSKSSYASFLQSAMGSVKDIEAFLEKYPRHTMAWRAYVRSLVQLGDFRKAEQVIRNWIKVLNPQSKSLVLTPLITLSLVAWEVAMKSSETGTDNKYWLALGEESINAVLQKTQKCATAFLIAAQFARSKGNAKLEKKFLKSCGDLSDLRNRKHQEQYTRKKTSDVFVDPFG